MPRFRWAITGGVPKVSRPNLVLKEPFVDTLLGEYLPILMLLAVATGLGLVLLLAAALIAVRNPDPEKLSAYECGFNAFVLAWRAAREKPR